MHIHTLNQTNSWHKPGTDVAVKQPWVTDTLREAVTQHLEPMYVHFGEQENDNSNSSSL